MFLPSRCSLCVPVPVQWDLFSCFHDDNFVADTFRVTAVSITFKKLMVYSSTVV